MSYAAQLLRRTLRRLLVIQGMLIAGVALAYLASKGWPHMLAALFGGGIALLNTLISAQRLSRASEAAAGDLRRGMFELYIGAIMRFIATPVLVAVGILLLHLDAVAIIAGFAVAQLGYVLGSARGTAGTTNS